MINSLLLQTATLFVCAQTTQCKLMFSFIIDSSFHCFKSNFLFNTHILSYAFNVLNMEFVFASVMCQNVFMFCAMEQNGQIFKKGFSLSTMSGVGNE